MQHLGDRLVFGALRASLGRSRSFLRRGALLLFTANGAHRSLRGYLLAIGHADMAGSYIGWRGDACDQSTKNPCANNPCFSGQECVVSILPNYTSKPLEYTIVQKWV